MSRPQLAPFRPSLIVREALKIAKARPAYAAGLRAGVATVLPLIFVTLVEQREMMWMSFAGFLAVLADKGGAYRTRALSMLVFALTSALAVLLGTACSASPPLALALVLSVVFAGGFVRVFGAEATSVGVLTSVTLVVALARPAEDAASSWASAGFTLLGHGWAALMSLLVWPLRPYRPARLAVALALRELALVAESFVAASVETAAQRERRERVGRAREVIEAARVALGHSRRSRPGPSRPGEQQLALLEACDQLFAALVALDDGLALDATGSASELPALLDRVATLVARELAQVAEALELERPLGPPTSELDMLSLAIAPLAQSRAEYVPRVLLSALERLDRLLEQARVSDGSPSPSRVSRAELRALVSETSPLSQLRDHLSLDSAMFRHALRMAVTTALASVVGHVLHIEHGYWATVTCIVIMQPHGAATWAKALQRVAGTVLGAALALLVATYVHEPQAVIACVFLFVAVAMALLPLNYGAFAIFLTPSFVLLAEPHAGGGGLALIRILNTALGAAIALVGSRLLFPLAERDQFRPLWRRVVEGVEALLAVAAAERPSQAALRAARREVGLALLNAEASYQRLLTEARLPAEESQALSTLLLYTHRLNSGLIALALAEGSASHARLRAAQDELACGLRRLRDGSDAPPCPESFRASGGRADRIDKLFEQLAVLESASARWHRLAGKGEG